jgi:DNA (cytosine-5)-methyltransferase 1
MNFAPKPFVEIPSIKGGASVKLVDLFAGIGGFHYGVEAAAAKRNYGVETLLVSEIDKFCQETYKQNHGVDVEGDINQINLKDYSGIADVLTAGFPCQPFSNSGLKMGLSDPRGQFYFRIEEIIKKFQSKTFILENVPGIKTNGGGKHESKLASKPQTIGSTMHFLEENLLKLKDYNIKWVELDSSKFGSPQVRRRVYIVGVHRDYGEALDLDFEVQPEQAFMSIAEKALNSDLELSANQDKNVRSFMSEAPSYHQGMRRVGQAYLCAGGNVGQSYHSYGLVPTLTKVWARFLPIYFPAEGEMIPTLGSREFTPNKEYGSGYLRRASVRETLRLQGFPDEFIPHESARVAYEQTGNAVNAFVVKHIAEKLLDRIQH